jgi:hypothetical protein
MNRNNNLLAFVSLSVISLICFSQPVAADIVIFESIILEAKGNNDPIDSIQNNAPVTQFPTVFEYEVISGGANARNRSSYSQEFNLTTLSYDFDFTREAGPNSYTYLLALPSFQISSATNFEFSASLEIDGTPNFVLMYIFLRRQSDEGIFGYAGQLENTLHDQFGFDAAGNYFDYDGIEVSGSPSGLLLPDLYVIQAEIGFGAFDSLLDSPATARGNVTLKLTAVPEPSSGLLWMLGGSIVLLVRKRNLKLPIGPDLVVVTGKR